MATSAFNGLAWVEAGFSKPRSGMAEYKEDYYDEENGEGGDAASVQGLKEYILITQ